MNEWKLEIVLFQGIDTYQAVLNALTQEHAKQYIYPCHSQTARFGNPAFCINNKDLISWISDLRSKMTIPCQAVLDSVSQEQTEQYIYSRHPELDSGAIQNDFLSISINRFRVKHGMTIKGALDSVSQEHVKQYIYPCHSQTARFGNPAFCINNKDLISWISDLRSKMTIPCHAAPNAISQKQTKQYISPRHPELDSGSIQLTISNSNEKGGGKSQQIQASHLNTSTKGGDKSLCIQPWHLNTSEKGGYKKCLA